MTLGIVLLQDPRKGVFLMSEVPLQRRLQASPVSGTGFGRRVSGSGGRV
jgi:hypothetical protein